MCQQKFFICRACGNLISVINDERTPMVCCDKPMEELCPNTVDAATEKHLPKVEVNNRLVHVSVGSVPHPMTPEHHIEFIYLQTENGGLIKCLNSDEKAHAMFVDLNSKPLYAFAYCNLHGLWKTEITKVCDCSDTVEENVTADETICSAEFAQGCI